MKNVVMMIVSLALFVACEDLTDDSVLDSNKKTTINLSLGDMVSVTDESISDGRIAVSDAEYVIVCISRNDIKYASGIFESDYAYLISLDLFGDEGTYDVQMKGIKPGTGYGVMSEYGIYNYGHKPITNALDYAEPYSMQLINHNYVYDSDSLTTYTNSYFPELDVYYGTTSIEGSDYNEQDTVAVDLYRKVFGIEAVVNNFTEGKVFLSLEDSYDANIEINYPTDSIFQIRAMRSVTANSFSVTTRITYDSGDGNEQLLFAENLNYYLLKTKRFEITLSDSTSSNGSATNFYVHYHDEALTPGDTVIVN